MKEWSKEDFGERLKDLRIQRGMSMMAFGAAIGTSASRIKDWEKGKNAPSAAWIAKISERFNVTTDELIMGSSHSDAFKTTGSTNVDTLYERLRETLTNELDAEENNSESMNYYHEVDEKNKLRYRSGKGRRLAEQEILEHIVRLPKKDVIELLELAKLKSRLQQ